jgi:hypothetical protein
MKRADELWQEKKDQVKVSLETEVTEADLDLAMGIIEATLRASAVVLAKKMPGNNQDTPVSSQAIFSMTQLGLHRGFVGTRGSDYREKCFALLGRLKEKLESLGYIVGYDTELMLVVEISR